MNIISLLNLDVYEIVEVVNSIHKRYDVFETVQSKIIVFAVIFTLVKMYQKRSGQHSDSNLRSDNNETNSLLRRQIFELGRMVASKMYHVVVGALDYFYSLFLKSLLQDLTVVVKKFVQILVDMNFISVEQKYNPIHDSFRRKTNFLINKFKELNSKKNKVLESTIKVDKTVSVTSNSKLSVKIDRPENNFIKQNIQKIQNSSSSADLKRTRAAPTYVKSYAGMSTNILNKVKKKLEIEKGQDLN